MTVGEGQGVRVCPICGQPTEAVCVADDGHEVRWPITHAHELPDLVGSSRVSSAIRQRQCFGRYLDCYRDCSMAGLVAPKPVVEAAERLIADVTAKPRASRRGLVLYGSSGVGKSYLAAAVANELMDQGRSVRWVHMEQLMRRPAHELELDVLPALCSRLTDVVVVDDFGSERTTDFGVAATTYVIGELYQAHACLLVTTNLTRSQLASPRGVEARRVLDRIKERCVTCEYAGHNKRQLGLEAGCKTPANARGGAGG